MINWYSGLILMGLLLSIPLFFIKHRYQKQHQIIFIILFVVTLVEIYGTYTMNRSINNTLAYNLVFVYLETYLIFWLFNDIFNSKKAKNILKIGAIVFTIWGLVNTFFIQDFLTFHTNSYTLGSFIIISSSIYYFVSIFLDEDKNEKQLVVNPLFWIVTFIFFFYSATFLYFLSYKLILNMDRTFARTLVHLNQVLAVILYIGMGTEFYLPFFFSKIRAKNVENDFNK